MPRPIQPSAFSYLLPTLVQSGVNSQSSGASGWTPGGALSLQIPDNTVIGGNPRGLGAVDLQTQRTAATQVASGAGSFVAGVNNTVSGSSSASMGSSNTVSGSNSFAVGGPNSVSGSYSAATGYNINISNDFSFGAGINCTVSASSAIAVGASCTASGQYAVAMGQSTANQAWSTAIGSSTASTNAYAFAGGNATASGSRSAALGGGNASNTYACAVGQGTASGQWTIASGLSTASGQYSVALGLATASAQFSAAIGRSTADQVGKFSFSGGTFGSTGDAQTGKFVARVATTDATPTVLTSDGTTAGTGNQLILSNSSAFTFSILVVGRQQAAGGTASAAFEIKGLIRREANAASTTLVNSATTVISNAPGWAVAVSADTTNGGLAITVTGAAATNIRWVATAYTSEVIYA